MASIKKKMLHNRTLDEAVPYKAVVSRKGCSVIIMGHGWFVNNLKLKKKKVNPLST